MVEGARARGPAGHRVIIVYDCCNSIAYFRSATWKLDRQRSRTRRCVCANVEYPSLVSEYRVAHARSGDLVLLRARRRATLALGYSWIGGGCDRLDHRFARLFLLRNELWVI